MKIIIAPDSFKGTLSATQVCDLIEEALKEKYPQAEIEKIPIADGGEGTVDCFLSIFGGEEVFVLVKSPLGKSITARYAFLKDGTAVIEMAAASGITAEKEKAPLKASTYGTGQLISHALEKGAKKIILGIGGSATTDGGVGCVQALGGKFSDKNGQQITPGGEGLLSLEQIDLSGLDKRIFSVEFFVLCDVKNPLFGENGAAFVYAPQKGADKEQVRLLDAALKNLARISKKTQGEDFSLCEGAGAAGGLGFSCIAFLGGRLISGIDYILSAADFERKAQSAELIITGEGKADSQSLMGKVLCGVAQKSGGTRLIAIVGALEGSPEDFRKIGIDVIIETNENHLPFEEIRYTASEDLKKAAKKVEII